MTGQSSNIRIRWNRATNVKIAPATVENVLRFVERSCIAAYSGHGQVIV
jgi:hypothetical protein